MHVILPYIKFKFRNTGWKNFLSLKRSVASSRVMVISLSVKNWGCGDNLIVKIIGMVDLNPILLIKEMGSFSKRKRKKDGVMILSYKVFGKDRN